VTVTFNVVPVPYTDRYEIKLEQVFETRVPAPVLVMTPPQYEFVGVTEGFEATVVYTLENKGLISLFDVEVTGSSQFAGSLTPLIEYAPELAAQQKMEIPVRIRYTRPDATSGASSTSSLVSLNAGGGLDCSVDTLFKNLEKLVDHFAGLAAGGFQCIDGLSARDAKAMLAILKKALTKNKYQRALLRVYEAICAIGSLLGVGSGGGGGGGPGPGRGSGYGGGMPACFTAETPVLLSDGSTIPIAELGSGDWVRAGSSADDLAEVRDVFAREVDSIRRLEVAPLDGGDSWVVDTTDDHLIWKDGVGWTAAQDLEAGDWLSASGGRLVRVVSSDAIAEPQTVYTVQLKGANALYAGGLLVHELCGNVSGYLPANLNASLQR
jgi:hypothetical protein